MKSKAKRVQAPARLSRTSMERPTDLRELRERREKRRRCMDKLRELRSQAREVGVDFYSLVAELETEATPQIWNAGQRRD